MKVNTSDKDWDWKCADQFVGNSAHKLGAGLTRFLFKLRIRNNKSINQVVHWDGKSSAIMNQMNIFRH